MNLNLTYKMVVGIKKYFHQTFSSGQKVQEHTEIRKLWRKIKIQIIRSECYESYLFESKKCEGSFYSLQKQFENNLHYPLQSRDY